jgi:RHS repeat-associated protein
VEEAKTGMYNSSTGFTLGNWNTPSYPLYDAWGQIRSGGTQNGSTSRYCASLGHVQDDESGLIYMRARYYEPGHGRFISEDDALQELNWYVYCGNNPVERFDLDGHEYFYDISGTLRAAFKVLMNPELSVIHKMVKLKMFLERMDLFFWWNGGAANALMSKAEVDMETAGLMGDAAAIEMRIAEFERGAAYIHRGEAVAALVAKAIIEIMLEMAKGEL